MKNIIIQFILIFTFLPLFGQMPTNGNYSNWDWQDQSQDNWKRKNGNVWMEINPPFHSITERIGKIVDVYESCDYTKTKGWQLLWAQFDGIYPYFILYSPHKGLVRAFFYLDTQEFNYALATLSYHDINNPGLLTFGNEYQIATDKYLDRSFPSDDMISVIIPFVGAENWLSADFPITFDPNIQNSKYNSKKWVFQFYGCEDYKIHLKGKSGPAETEQHTITGSSSNVTSSNFSATHSKLHKQFQTNDKFMEEMQKSVKSINDTSPKYLQGYKTTVESLKPVAGIFSAAVGISSGVGAVLGFMKIVNGTFDEQKSTPPTAVIQYIELEGSMKIKYNLGGNTLKIPGVNGSYSPSGLYWSPYDCPMGYFNLEKTPTIRKTSSYEKFKFDDDDVSIGFKGDKPSFISKLFNYPWLNAEGEHLPVSGYLGNFVKYKFEDDNIIAVNEIPGLTLIDIHFALVAKLTGTGTERFDIEAKYINCKFWDLNGREFHVPVINPIYKALEEGVLKVYKYDEVNDGIYIGTPELSMNKLKDIVIELPEKADLALRVIAKFNSDKYDKPIIFQGNFNMITVNETAQQSRLFAWMEQTNFHWTDYYTDELKIILNSSNSSSHRAGSIIMEPGFYGNPGFSAVASNIYPSRGNTKINYYSFNCSSSLKNATILQGNANNECLIKTTSNLLTVFPNPNNGQFTVSSANESNEIATIKVFNSMGILIYTNNNVSLTSLNLKLDNTNSGFYIVQTILKDNTSYTNRVYIK